MKRCAVLPWTDARATWRGGRYDAQAALFVCVHNSARSQMAEAFSISSARGTRSQQRRPRARAISTLVVEVMRAVGIDLAGKETQEVWTLAKRGRCSRS